MSVEPVTKKHTIEFETYVKSPWHDDIANGVCKTLSSIAPLMIREAELNSELTRVRQEMATWKKELGLIFKDAE